MEKIEIINGFFKVIRTESIKRKKLKDLILGQGVTVRITKDNMYLLNELNGYITCENHKEQLKNGLEGALYYCDYRHNFILEI